jgi:exodeoxyribonuclease VII small subunit
VPAKKRSEPSTGDTADRPEPGGDGAQPAGGDGPQPAGGDGGPGSGVPQSVGVPQSAEGQGAVEGLDSLSYEQARDELVDVVRRLEAGGASLEDSLALWERGEALAARCQTWLDGARARLDAVRA